MRLIVTRTGGYVGDRRTIAVEPDGWWRCTDQNTGGPAFAQDAELPPNDE